jgi:hypothetical protein
MVPGVVQPDLPAPGGEPPRAADNNVEGLIARTVGRANKRTCDKRERLKLSRKHRRIGFKVQVLQFGSHRGNDAGTYPSAAIRAFGLSQIS